MFLYIFLWFFGGNFDSRCSETNWRHRLSWPRKYFMSVVIFEGFDCKQDLRTGITDRRKNFLQLFMYHLKTSVIYCCYDMLSMQIFSVSKFWPVTHYGYDATILILPLRCEELLTLWTLMELCGFRGMKNLRVISDMLQGSSPIDFGIATV